MDQSICKLTLVYPPSGEDMIVDLLTSAEPPIHGFTTWMAEGHGHDFERASPAEQVRGRIKRGVIVVIVERSRVSNLLAQLQTDAPVAHLIYWIEPIEAFGRLEKQSPLSADLDGGRA